MKHELNPQPSDNAGQEPAGEIPLIDRLFPPLEEGDKRTLFLNDASHGSDFINSGSQGGHETVSFGGEY